MFDTNWDVDKYKNEYECEEHWHLRRQFMVAHKHKFSESRLVCLTQVFFNMEFLGCKYPQKTMDLVNKLAAEVAEEFRDSRKDKLKRTFVGAQDAAGARTKGTKPPPGVVEGFQNNKQSDSVEQEEYLKKPRLVQKQMIDQNQQQEIETKNTNITVIGNMMTGDLSDLSKTFSLVIPPRANSKTEEDPFRIIRFNFPGDRLSIKYHGSKTEGGWTTELWVKPLPKKGKPSHLIASFFASTQREGRIQAAAIAVENLKKYCTYLEPSPDWFQNGGTPEFIKKRLPCNKRPRTYLIMTKKETGHITPEVADLLIENFIRSSNKDMFFLDVEYNEKEKIYLQNRSHIHQLGFRHFGSKIMLKDHHVCIYKNKTADEILEEARRLEWKHPKYLIRLKTPHTE